MGVLACVAVVGSVSSMVSPSVIREHHERARWEQTKQDLRISLREQERREDEYYADHPPAMSERQFGLALSFDDRDVDGWYAFFTRQDIRELSDVRVTFYVTQPDRLTAKEIGELKVLESMGHQIGCHGLRHVSARGYVNKHGVQAYLRDEVAPAVQALVGHGFAPPSHLHTHMGRVLTNSIGRYFNTSALSVEQMPVDQLTSCWDRGSRCRQPKEDGGSLGPARLAMPLLREDSDCEEPGGRKRYCCCMAMV